MFVVVFIFGAKSQAFKERRNERIVQELLSNKKMLTRASLLVAVVMLHPLTLLSFTQIKHDHSTVFERLELNAGKKKERKKTSDEAM